jgi:hypothetical protein
MPASEITVLRLVLVLAIIASAAFFLLRRTREATVVVPKEVAGELKVIKNVTVQSAPKAVQEEYKRIEEANRAKLEQVTGEAK